MSHQKTCWKGYDGVDAPKWNLEVEPFIAQWIIQTEDHIHELGMVEDHNLPWSVVGKEMCYYWFMLRLQEKKDVNQP
jgi:hypothetical protein